MEMGDEIREEIWDSYGPPGEEIRIVGRGRISAAPSFRRIESKPLRKSTGGDTSLKERVQKWVQPRILCNDESTELNEN
jgi:hypothetical protein